MLRKRRIEAAFGAAGAYDDHAVAQRHAAGQLATRIAALPLPPRPRVLEIGCGTGLLAAACPELIARADWLMTDIAPDMLARSRARFAGEAGARFALLDGEHPVFDPPEPPFDLICSNFAVQWFDDIEGALAGLIASLAPGGHLLLSTLAADTFAEWRQAHRAAGLAPGTPSYPPIDRLTAMRPGGVRGCVTRDIFVERHASAAHFLRALKAIGAGTPAAGRRPLAPGALSAVMHGFEAAGAIARYDIAYCHFIRPERTA